MPSKVNGKYKFAGSVEFQPNLHPKYILHNGFGGTYFRDIHNPKTKKWHRNGHTRVPKSWLKGLDIATEVESQRYSKNFNKYGVKCGASYEYWIQQGWIKDSLDPYGWYEWYINFFRGRRSPDDTRQIKRWANIAGSKGRFRLNLCGKIWKKGHGKYDQAVKLVNDYTISPVIRQTLLHWGYELTKADFHKYCKDKGYI